MPEKIAGKVGNKKVNETNKKRKIQFKFLLLNDRLFNIQFFLMNRKAILVSDLQY
jgi:hypothetical protein